MSKKNLTTGKRALAKTGNLPSKSTVQKHGNLPVDHKLADVIDGMFASFDLLYPHQFRNSFAETERLAHAKKLWYDFLQGIPLDCLQKALKRTIRDNEFIPTVKKLLDNCIRELQLPEPWQAWREAQEGASYWQDYEWSHPAVLLAAQQTGWINIENDTPNIIYPQFVRNYRDHCLRAVRGEPLNPVGSQ